MSRGNESMSDVAVFDFRGAEVRVVTVDGEPWWVAKDVCEVLGYARPNDAVTAHCKGAVKRRTLTSGGEQDLLTISERDLYRLIMRSRLPDAERFEEWVVGEVLPSIRKTGSYASKPVDTLDAIIAMATELKDQRARLDKIEQDQRLLLNPPDTGYCTVRGYFNLRDISIGEIEAARIGKEATKLCRENGYTIEQVRDNRYGRVNSYPIAVLQIVVGDTP